MDLSRIDRKGLVREAYRIDGITAGECRTIFLDWALSVADGMDTKDAINALLDVYAPDAPNHPMTDVLREGLAAQPDAKRRGGRRGRLAASSSD